MEEGKKGAASTCDFKMQMQEVSTAALGRAHVYYSSIHT